MSSKITSIIQDGSITVLAGGKPFTVGRDNPQYDDLLKAIGDEDMDAVMNIVTASDRLTKVISQFGDVAVFAGHVTFQGRPVHNYVVERIVAMMKKGHDPAPYARFLDRVMRNPSYRAAQELFNWMEKAKLPLAPDGRVLAFKNTRGNYLDIYSGTFDNSPGSILSMPRQEVDDNSAKECSVGLHFAAASYLNSFKASDAKGGNRTVLMAIDPADVVAFPRGYNGSKGRCWKYEVLFEIESIAEAQTFFDPNDPVFDYEAYLKARTTAKTTTAVPTTPNATVVPTDPKTFEDRLIRLEMHLGLHPTDVWLFSDRLTKIEVQLGLTDNDPPQIARLERCEASAGF